MQQEIRAGKCIKLGQKVNTNELAIKINARHLKYK
jgi:hypothetical protein